MAFDIVRTQRSLPGRGRGVRADINLDTGGQLVAQAIGELGRAGINTAIVLNRLQADNQFSEAKRQQQEIFDQFQDAIARDPDSTHYPEIAKQALSAMSQVAPKNRLANRGYRMLLNRTKASMTDTVLDISLARERDTKRADVALMMTDGRFGMARKFIRSGVKDGTFSKLQAQSLIAESEDDEKEFINQQQFLAGQRFAMNQPEVFLAQVKGAKVEGLDDLTPGQVQALRATAEGTINFQNRRQGEIEFEIRNEIFSQAATVTPSEMHTKISAMNISPGTKEELFSSFMSVQRALDQGKPNPFEKTQDFIKYANMIKRIEAGETMTNQDIDKEWLAAGKDKPSWSLIHNKQLKQMLEDRDETGKESTKFSRTHPAAQLIFLDHLQLYGADTLNELDDKVKGEYIQERLQLEDIMRDNWNNPVLMRKLTEQLQEAVKDKQTKGILRRLFEIGSPLGLVLKAVTGKKGEPFELLSATNPQTGERLISFNGGKTWQKAR